MTIDEELLGAVDEIVQNEKTNRSAFIRFALEEAVRRHKIALLEEMDAAGYARIPQSDEKTEDWQTEQDWGEGWSAAK